jgi:hypothetical protein
MVVFVVAFNGIGVYFQTEVYKKPDNKDEHPLFTVEKYAVT